MAKKNTKVSLDRVCKTCALYEPATGYCKKKNEQTPGIRYACEDFRTPAEWKAECEARRQERLQKEEHRLNFILTALYIQSTATMQMLEYFDAQFQDKKAEADWRFARKRAANEIDRAVKKIRDLYQHNFMVDQTQVMTNHGKEAFDANAYDCHEDDARRWNKLLLHHMESSWQDEAKEAQILNYYENLPHVGIFEPKDYKHTSSLNDKDMEEKTITIKMKDAHPVRRVLKNWKFWAFIACALLVAVCEAIDGNWICVIWVIIAASFKFFADLFEEYSFDFYDLNGQLILEQEALQDALKEKDDKIAELQTENISLRFGKTTKQ